MYFFRVYRFQTISQKKIVIQPGDVKMTSHSQDMTFHRENGRMRLLKTFK